MAAYRFDVQERCLWRGSKRVPLSATDTAILGYLLSRPHRLVTRDELLTALWPQVAVSPGLVKVRVRRLRRTLGDRIARPRFIETVHGRGYRFIGNVGRTEAPEPGRGRRDRLRHLCRAARNAIRRRAPHEAIAVARRALPLLSSLTDAGERASVEQELRVTLGRLELVRRGATAPEVLANYTRLRRLCDVRPADPSALPGLVALARFELNRGDIHEAHRLATQVHRLATESRPRDLAGAHTLLGAVEFNAGHLVSAEAHLGRARALHDAAQSDALATAYGENVEVPLEGYRALVLWHRGFPKRALQASRTALAIARELRLPAPMAFALGMATWLHRLRGEAAAVARLATQLYRLADDQGFPAWRAQATFELGWAAAARGGIDEGRARMREGLAQYRASGARLYEIGDRLAVLEIAPGAVADHGATLDALIASATASGQRYHESILHCLKGDWWRQRGHEAKAVASFERAIAVAIAQGAKDLERRARARLAGASRSSASRSRSRRPAPSARRMSTARAAPRTAANGRGE